MASTQSAEDQRPTRRIGRCNSVSEQNNVLTFDKPVTIDKPGAYKLNGEDSKCSFHLFDSTFSKEYCQQLSNHIDSLPSLIQHSTTAHKGAPSLLPRLSSWYGPIDYAYSKVVMQANSISDVPNISIAYKHIAEKLLTPNGLASNSDCFLINKYRNGRDSCGEHSDNEPEVDQEYPIITLSLGQTRYMLIRELTNPGNAISIKLCPGSVLVMNGPNFQKYFTHQIPKDTCTQSRTSITFRTCSPLCLQQRNAQSTPIMQLVIPPTQLTLPITPSSSLIQKRRSSVSNKGDGSPMTLSNLQLLNSPNQSPSSSMKSDSSSKISNDTLPLSLEAMIEAVDHLKENTLKQELSRLGSAIPATPAEKRKKLKKAVKESHKKFICKPLSTAQPEPECVINAISTLEQSMINLQSQIQAQHLAIDELMICSDKKDSKPSSTEFPKELNMINTRIEKIEDILDSYKQNQEEVSQTVSECKKGIAKIETQSSEACNRLRSMQTASMNPHGTQTRSKSPPQFQSTPRRRSYQMQPNTRTPGYRENRPPRDNMPKKSRNVLLIHDSQLNELDPEKFSSSFSIQKFKAGSYSDLLQKHSRTVISKPNIDCYAIELGINDYRYNSSNNTLSKAIEDAKSCIEKLLECSKAKIVVSLPTPTPGPHENRTTEFAHVLTEFVTAKRGLSDNHQRLFTVNNLTNFYAAIEAADQSDEKPNPLREDNLHVSEYGMKKLCLNIKLGLYRAFGMKQPTRQTPSE